MTVNKRPTRDAFGETMIELAQNDERIFVIDSDISKSMKTVEFSKKFPDRHINVGIAEQNSGAVAAGLATTGKIPFISTYAVFGSMRMLEQIRTSVCYSKLNVKVACSHAGLTPGNDGVTHQAIEDMGIYRTIPNMTVMMGADYNQTKMLLRQAAKYEGPIYIRFTRDAVPIYYSETEQFEIGKGKILRNGNDISIFAIGDLLHQAIEAAEILSARGVSVELVDMHTLKPLDAELVYRSVSKTKRAITAEDHSIVNGLGSAVGEVISECGCGVLRRIGLCDCFAESGDYYKLLEKYEMDASAIVRRAEELLQK